MYDRPAWQHRASCRGASPALFYSDDPADQAAAKAICATCPVADRCLSARSSEPGLWGGLTEAERDRARAASRRGPEPSLADEALAAVLAGADPERPALAQLLDAVPVATSTAYRYLDKARRQGLVEVRGGRLFPARR